MYTDIEVTKKHQVATIRMYPSGHDQYERHQREGIRNFFPKHKEIGHALEAIRDDNAIRVVVLTGTDDIFFVPPPTSPGISAHKPGEDWDAWRGLRRTLQTIIEIEKPVIARLNGDAVGFGSSLLFACDLTVAASGVTVADHHLGMGELKYGRPEFGVVPGDGGAVFVPLHMPPAMANEYLLLAKPYTSDELGELGLLNRVVSTEELDPAVQEMVDKLLARSAYALAWSKRVINRGSVQRFHLVYDAGIAYEKINILQNRQLTVASDSDGEKSDGAVRGLDIL